MALTMYPKKCRCLTKFLVICSHMYNTVHAYQNIESGDMNKHTDIGVMV